MKLKLAILGLCLAGSIAAFATLTSAEDKVSGDKPMMPTPEQMKAWMDFSTPGEGHKALEAFVGDWKGVVKGCDCNDPNKTSESLIFTKSIMGGRYLEESYSGEMMGMPFEGRNLIGYDNDKKKYHSYWIDNMGTAGTFMEGDYDAKAKTFKFTGKMYCPMCKDMLPIRSEIVWTSKDSYTMKMFVTMEGKEMPMMDSTVTRMPEKK